MLRCGAGFRCAEEGLPFMVRYDHPDGARASRVEQTHRHIARMLFEGEVKLEGGIERLVDHSFLEGAVELLHFRARRDFGEELFPDRVLLRNRGKARLDGIVFENASGAVELNHAIGQDIEISGRQFVDTLQDAVTFDRHPAWRCDIIGRRHVCSMCGGTKGCP
jgi:hypothetical protein